MNTYQWIGIIVIAAMLFGSLGLGRYLRWRDEQDDKAN